MKPLRRSLQLAKDAPFVSKRQVNSGSVQGKQAKLPQVRNRGLNVTGIDQNSERAVPTERTVQASSPRMSRVLTTAVQTGSMATRHRCH